MSTGVGEVHIGSEVSSKAGAIHHILTIPKILILSVLGELEHRSILRTVQFGSEIIQVTVVSNGNDGRIEPLGKGDRNQIVSGLMGELENEYSRYLS